jgi:hypothetical protein
MADDVAETVRLLQAFRDVLTASDAEPHIVASAVGSLVGGICLMSDSPDQVYEAIGHAARITFHHAPAGQMAAAIKARHAS